MLSFVKILIYIQMISIIKADWIKISQDSIPNIQHKDISTSTIFNKDNYHHLSSILDDRGHKTETPPSQEWLNYQKIRFSVGAENTQKLIVTKTEKLKNSAEVIIPNIIQNKTILPENLNYKNKQATEKNQERNFQKPILKNIDNFHTEENSKLNKVLISEKGSDDAEQKLFSKVRNEKNKFQTPSFSGFLEFLKSMQSKLISNTAKGIKDKINKLSELRDKLLLNIEDRIIALWPTVKQTKRSKRGILDDSQSNFPSAETALMTINFLTFAVFLIKLVLQVIKTIKSKHYNFNGFAINTMEAIKMSNARKNARHFGESLDDIEKTEKILSAIENFKD